MSTFSKLCDCQRFSMLHTYAHLRNMPGFFLGKYVTDVYPKVYNYLLLSCKLSKMGNSYTEPMFYKQLSCRAPLVRLQIFQRCYMLLFSTVIFSSLGVQNGPMPGTKKWFGTETRKFPLQNLKEDHSIKDEVTD